MDARRPRVAVVCGRAPIPDETFIRREIEVLRCSNNVRVFGLAWRFPALGSLRLLRGMALRDAASLLPRMRTVREIASFVAGDGRIIAHFAWRTADIAAAASRLSGCPWECHVHAWDIFARPQPEIRRRLETASKIVACSRTAADAVEACGIPAERISVAMHPLPMGKIAARLHSARPPVHDRPFRVAAVGRLVPKKGFDTILLAWPLFLEGVGLTQGDGARLVIVGDGPERGKLRRLANAPSIPRGSVVFRGRLSEDETLDEIAGADLFVLPSRRMPDGDRDGISNALREAMALGVRVVTTDAGAAVEVASASADVTVLHAPVAPESLADAMAREFAGLHNNRP